VISVYPCLREAALARARYLIFVLPILFSACGQTDNPAGGSNPTPTAAPTATVTACQGQTLLKGTAPIPAQAVLFTEFTLKASGRVDVSIDWTRADATMRIAIVQGQCNANDFKANTCTKLLDVKAPPKPAKGSVNLVADTYSVAFESQSNFKDMLSYSVVRADAGCPVP
jgi:hypothetical protein